MNETGNESFKLATSTVSMCTYFFYSFVLHIYDYLKSLRTFTLPGGLAHIP